MCLMKWTKDGLTDLIKRVENENYGFEKCIDLCDFISWYNKNYKEFEENKDTDDLRELTDMLNKVNQALKNAVEPMNMKVFKDNINDTVYIIPTTDKPLKLIIED